MAAVDLVDGAGRAERRPRTEWLQLRCIWMRVAHARVRVRDLTAVFFFCSTSSAAGNGWQEQERTLLIILYWMFRYRGFAKMILLLGLEMGCRQSPATAGAAPFSSPADPGPARSSIHSCLRTRRVSEYTRETFLSTEASRLPAVWLPHHRTSSLPIVLTCVAEATQRRQHPELSSHVQTAAQKVSFLSVHTLYTFGGRCVGFWSLIGGGGGGGLQCCYLVVGVPACPPLSLVSVHGGIHMYGIHLLLHTQTHTQTHTHTRTHAHTHSHTQRMKPRCETKHC